MVGQIIQINGLTLAEKTFTDLAPNLIRKSGSATGCHRPLISYPFCSSASHPFHPHHGASLFNWLPQTIFGNAFGVSSFPPFFRLLLLFLGYNHSSTVDLRLTLSGAKLFTNTKVFSPAEWLHTNEMKAQPATKLHNERIKSIKSSSRKS